MLKSSTLIVNIIFFNSFFWNFLLLYDLFLDAIVSVLCGIFIITLSLYFTFHHWLEEKKKIVKKTFIFTKKNLVMRKTYIQRDNLIGPFVKWKEKKTVCVLQTKQLCVVSLAIVCIRQFYLLEMKRKKYFRCKHFSWFHGKLLLSRWFVWEKIECMCMHTIRDS